MSISDSALESCQQIIGYEFRDVTLLATALTHASIANDRLESNERLEFFGDAVLGMIVCHELYNRFPQYLEGELTKIKSMIVSRRTCTRVADNMNLAQFLQVGKGMSNQDKIPDSCVAGAIESIIGAIYIDGGEQAARDFVLRYIGPWIDNADADEHQENFKSMLQQYAQRVMDTTPTYEVLDEKGPDHSKCFEVSVVIGQKRFASAWGTCKKDAEQIAAFYALKDLAVISPDTIFPLANPNE